MAKPAAGWGRSGHRRSVILAATVVAVILGGGAAAWAETSGGSAGYRMATVTRADIATMLTVVGNVEPVSQATSSFQVGGQVATVGVTVGQQVTAGQTLGTLNTTALSEAVSSAQSTLQADEAKLAEDEANQSSAAANGSSSSTPKSSTPSTTTTMPASSGPSSAQSAAITSDQKTLTHDETTLNTDQQTEAADLAQAQSDCSNANTSTSQGQATCEAALQMVSADEQQVSKDQSTVSKDETALGQALNAASNGGSSGGGNQGTSPNQSAQEQAASTSHIILTAAVTPNTGTGGNANAANTGSPGSTNTDTPAQIASDQAAIDTAEAQLTNAQQSLNEATLTSPIAGTAVAVNISVGDTVGAASSTETVTIVGTDAYEAQATLDSSEISSVKVGQSASVAVDGIDNSFDATVTQVGPVESSSSGYSYPVVVALPATNETLHAGSAANITISTGKTANVVAIPTAALQSVTSGATYVLVLSKGQLTRKVIRIGMVGAEYSQVLSGLSPGQSVVLADYAESVPSSSSNTNLGGLLGGGGGGFPGGGRFFQRSVNGSTKGAGVPVQIGG